MDSLLTVKETAEYLKVHPNTVYKRIKSGSIPFIRKEGLGLRFRLKDIGAWLEKSTFNPQISPDYFPSIDICIEKYDKLKLKGDSAVAKKKQRWNYGFGTVYIRDFKGKKRFCVDYKDHIGKRVRHVIPNVQTREEAVLYLQAKVTESFDRRHSTKRLSQIRFDDFAALYLKEYAKINKRSWKTDEYRLKAIIPYFGRYELQMIAARDIERFRAERIAAGNKHSTTNRSLTLLKKMLNVAIDWEYLNENPVTKVKMFPEHDILKEKVITAEEESRLLSVSPEHLRAIILVALNTGMRKGEILKLEWKNIDLAERMITVCHTKSGWDRKIPINDTLYGLFNRIGCKVERVFPYSCIQTSFETARRKSGLSVRFHDLRHTFASRLIANGVDVVTVSNLLGHQSVKTTERYLHTDAEQKRKAVLILTRICHEGSDGDRDSFVNRSFSVN